ncbi:DUF397 domain-containing protein [Nocardia harenae]|nr:DUF397 domain-containing protein [Nocardia harenae]
MSADLTGARWFKSTFSQAGGDCVEVAHLDGGPSRPIRVPTPVEHRC